MTFLACWLVNYWLSNVETALCMWTRSYMVMVYNSFYTLPWFYFVEDFLNILLRSPLKSFVNIFQFTFLLKILKILLAWIYPALYTQHQILRIFQSTGQALWAPFCWPLGLIFQQIQLHERQEAATVTRLFLKHQGVIITNVLLKIRIKKKRWN